MLEIEKISENLFDKIRSRFADISIGDENAKTTIDPTKARFFNFNFVVDETEFGNVTISLIDTQSLKIYYDQEIAKKMDKNQQLVWYTFLKDIRLFAKRNMLTFDIRDIAKSGLDVKDLRHLNKEANTFGASDINESKLYGTSRSSYQQLESVRIIARHTKPVDEQQHGARARNIKAIYIENSEGERFKLPEGTTLNGARAYARHVKNGGMLHDEFGQYIGKMIKEMADLKMFVRNTRGKTFDDAETMAMVEAAIDHYGSVHRDLFGLRSQRGYERYIEGWQADTDLIDEVNIAELKDRFTRRVFDDRLTGALPLVQRAYVERKNKVSDEFESWADSVIEEDNEIENSMFANDNDIDSNTSNPKIEDLLTSNQFEFSVTDGKYYFDSGEEVERAKDVIAAFDPAMEFPPMGVIARNDTYASSTNDRELGAYTMGVMEDEQLDELDIFAPETAYIRMPNGQYFKADWRRNQSGPGMTDSASFVKVEPIAPQAAKTLGLDARLANKTTKYINKEIAAGGAYQGSGPLADRRITLVDLSDTSQLGIEQAKELPTAVTSKLNQFIVQQSKAVQPAPVAEDFDISFIKTLAGLTK